MPDKHGTEMKAGSQKTRLKNLALFLVSFLSLSLSLSVSLSFSTPFSLFLLRLSYLKFNLIYFNCLSLHLLIRLSEFFFKFKLLFSLFLHLRTPTQSHSHSHTLSLQHQCYSYVNPIKSCLLLYRVAARKGVEYSPAMFSSSLLITGHRKHFQPI